MPGLKASMRVLKLGRPTLSIIFVDAGPVGEIRQGLPTRTVDKEGSFRTQKTWSTTGTSPSGRNRRKEAAPAALRTPHSALLTPHWNGPFRFQPDRSISR